MLNSFAFKMLSLSWDYISAETRRGFQLRSLLIIWLVLHSQSSFPQCNAEEIHGFRKSALIIGEKNYKENHLNGLEHTLNDADDMADSLSEIGFEISRYTDIDQRTSKQVIEKWLSSLNEYDVALFYFSGHGAEIDGINYLFPTDAAPNNKFEISDQTIPANKIIYDLNNLQLKYSIVILDACRTNPLTRSWTRNSTEGGLSSMNGGKNMFIAYAAEAGKSALDGYKSARNGVYTEAILKFITQPNLTIDQIFTKINREVQLKTQLEQVPYRTTSFSTDYCFNATNTDNLRRTNFTVGASMKMALSVLTNEAFVIDSNKISVKKLRSNTSYFFSPNEIKPHSFITGKSDIYVLDSLQKRLFVINPEQKKIKVSIPLKFRPYAFCIDRNEQKAYISFWDSLRYGIEVVDIKRGVTEKDKFFSSPILSIASGNDNLYCFTAVGDSINFLYSLSPRNFSILNSCKLKSQIKNLTLSVDNKYLFASNSFGMQKNVLIFNAETLSIAETIFQEANSFIYTKDDNYILLANPGLVFFKIKEKQQTNKLTFESEVKEVSLIGDEAYLLLNNQERIYFKNLKGNYERKDSASTIDVDEKIKQFARKNLEIVASKKIPLRKSAQCQITFSHLSDQTNYILGQLVEEIGPPYFPIYNVQLQDTTNFLYNVEIGLTNNVFSINATMICKIINEDAYVTLTDRNGKTESFQYPYSEKTDEAIKNNIIRPAIRRFFGIRLD